jgi:hypothetical protein
MTFYIPGSVDGKMLSSGFERREKNAFCEELRWSLMNIHLREV